MKKKSMISIALAASMVVCDSPLVMAADKNTPKEEVVYINLTPEGKVDNVTAVNVFNLAKAGDIVDYGNYLSVRNMTTTDEIDFKDGTVRMSADAGRIYYEGTLGKTEIPWTINIGYTLDGKPVNASELSGQSGFLRIHLTVKPNSSSSEVFYKHYALQISLTLDTDICTNISANGATSANVGSDRQLTYTLLPGKEADILVSTDVTDFHMDPIAINGILLDMNLGDIDVNSGEAGDVLDELKDDSPEYLSTFKVGQIPFLVFQGKDADGPYRYIDTMTNGYAVVFYAYVASDDSDVLLPMSDADWAQVEAILTTFRPAG
jgi:putative membrane protein